VRAGGKETHHVSTKSPVLPIGEELLGLEVVIGSLLRGEEVLPLGGNLDHRRLRETRPIGENTLEGYKRLKLLRALQVSQDTAPRDIMSP